MSEITFARHDTTTCLTAGLFRSLPRGRRERLDVTHIHNSVVVRFLGPDVLNATDLRVLQGLIALAGPLGRVLTPEPPGPKGKELRQRLELRWDATSLDALTVRSSFRRLAELIGMPTGGSQIRQIRDSVERLWATSVIVEYDGRREGYRLLADYSSDAKEDQLVVALSPQLVRAVIGGQHVRIPLAEVRALRSDAARIIHQRLCAQINPGAAGSVSMDVLMGYVWPETASENTVKKRRKTVRQALAEIEEAGWRVVEYRPGRWRLLRPPPDGAA